MCLEESFCPFTTGAPNFGQPKMCSGYSPSAVITAPCNAQLYHSAQLPEFKLN